MYPKQKSLFFIFLSFVFVWVSAGCRGQSGSVNASEAPVRQSGPRIKAPDFELLDISGKKVTLKEFKGKVVFLDFWATWCPPCVLSSPEVDKISHEYAGKKVEVLSISLDDEAETVKAFVARKNVTNRMLMVGSSGVDVHYQVNGIPTFFIIDQDGYFVASWSGYSPAMAKVWRSQIDALLKS
jgi:thiol-disulfide isomerase/thioredoxin